MKWFSLLLLIANIGLAGWGLYSSKTGPIAVVSQQGSPTAGRGLVLLSEVSQQGVVEQPALPAVAEADDAPSTNQISGDASAESAQVATTETIAASREGVTFQKMVDPQPAPAVGQEFVPNNRSSDALTRSASGIAKVFSQASATTDDEFASGQEVAANPSAASQTAPANQYCVSIGPLAKRVDADRVQQLLQPLNLTSSKVRTEPTASKNGYWVVIPAHASVDEAKQRVRDLEAAGISGIWRFTKGSLANAISLGLFSQRSNAERYVEEIAGKGFPAEVVPRTEEKDAYWLDFMRDEKPVVPTAMWSRITGEFPELELASKPCSSIVSR